MKKRCTFLLVLCLLAQIAQAQFPADCPTPEIVQHHYLSSAKVLALRQMLGDPNWKDSVHIPEAIYRPMLNGLLSVYQSFGIPQRDTVVECLDIQNYYSPYSPVNLSLSVELGETWAENLHQGIFPTGNSMVDQWMNQYGLKKHASYKLSKYFFFLESEELLNTVALAKLFSQVPNTTADADGGVGDPPSILVDTIGGKIQMAYSIGWGDCPSGCIFHRRWTFQINADCSADFIKVEGNALTSEVSCNRNYDCYSDPLCLPWLQDSLASYAAQYPPCSATGPELRLFLYQPYGVYPLLAISVDQGFDAGFTDFFYCDGSKIGSCQLTIAGPICSPGYLAEYYYGDEIWTCLDPLPDPSNCTTGLHPEPGEVLSMMLFPNPSAEGTLTVQTGANAPLNGIIEVYDATGRVRYSRKVKGENTRETLEMKGLAPGVYWVKYQGAKGAVVRKWVIAG